MGSNNELVILEDLYLIVVRPMSKLFAYDEKPEDGAGFWVPNSLIKHTDIAEVGEQGFISIPEWKAEELDLI